MIEMMMLYQMLKVLFLLCLITLFLLLFGLPSLSRYLERRYVFSDDKVYFDLNRPPTIIVYHVPLNETANGNAGVIEKCINKDDDYQESIKCVNENLPDKNEIFLQDQTKDIKGRVFLVLYQIKIYKPNKSIQLYGLLVSLRNKCG